MPYRIDSIELFVREMPPARMKFSIGRQKGSVLTNDPAKRRPGAILLCRAKVSNGEGKSAEGCSGDRPSYGWLDKRPGRNSEEKLALLLDLVEAAREKWLEAGRKFESVFSLWQVAKEEVAKVSREAGAEDLMGSYASAMMERAVIDAVCWLEDKSFHEMVKENRLGIDPGAVHPQLEGVEFGAHFPDNPRTRFWIRHTVGLVDPIDDADWPGEKRIDDGEPETLLEYVEQHRLRYFKIKVSGDAERDLARLDAIWNRALAPAAEEPVITLDGNEAWDDIEAFAGFVDRFEREIPGMWDHTLFIEQPLTRALTLDPETTPWVRRIAEKKPLVIDEADGSPEAFRKAFGIGYSGCSHKNCKGVIKSLLNRVLCAHFEETTGREVFMSGEDLSLMPIVPLHQDFAALGVLGIAHCERNGHHYAFGLSHLTKKEKDRIAELNPDLYYERDGEWFLRVNSEVAPYPYSAPPGQVETIHLHAAGFGTVTRPDWDALVPLAEWREKAGA